MLKWIVGIVVLGFLVCAGALGGGGWYWWQLRQREASARVVEEQARAEAAAAVEKTHAVEAAHVARLDAARAATVAGDWREAESAFSDVLEVDPKLPEALIGRGRAYARMDRLDLAETDLRDATRLAPKDPLAWESLAWVLGKEGQDGAAVAALDQLIALDSGNAKAWRDRANSKYHSGDIDGAREDAAQACRLGLDEGCVLGDRIHEARR